MTTMQNVSGENNGYDPTKLLNYLLELLALKNDAALSKVLNVPTANISRIRNLRRPLNARLLVRIHELTGIPTRELRAIMGDRREYFDR